MSDTIELQLEPRTTTGKNVKRLRREGLLPGILYGFSIEPQPVQVALRTFERTYHRAGFVHLVDLKMGESGAVTRAFISNIKRHPITHALAHVDFRAVNLREEAIAHVPIVLTGEPAAVADDSGLLMQVLDTLTIKVLPTEVPEQFTVDVSGLSEVGAMLHVRDLTIPPGVTLITDGEEVVARINAVSVTAAEEEAAAAEATEEQANEAATGEGSDTGA